mmetsp:Transcript_17444/g.25909  ORF Transcript_17444/g.25909 Transcript_17444/m.25909 type:complete len:81 (-) Transcript_17444:289-531(-)
MNEFNCHHRLSDDVPTFHAYVIVGTNPNRRMMATNPGVGSGNGMNGCTKLRMSSGIGARRNATVATRLANKYRAQTLAAQ